MVIGSSGWSDERAVSLGLADRLILKQEEINALIDESHRRYPNDPTDGFAYKDATPYEARWKTLRDWRRDITDKSHDFAKKAG